MPCARVTGVAAHPHRRGSHSPGVRPAGQGPPSESVTPDAEAVAVSGDGALNSPSPPDPQNLRLPEGESVEAKAVDGAVDGAEAVNLNAADQISAENLEKIKEELNSETTKLQGTLAEAKNVQDKDETEIQTLENTLKKLNNDHDNLIETKRDLNDEVKKMRIDNTTLLQTIKQLEAAHKMAVANKENLEEQIEEIKNKVGSSE